MSRSIDCSSNFDCRSRIESKMIGTPGTRACMHARIHARHTPLSSLPSDPLPTRKPNQTRTHLVAGSTNPCAAPASRTTRARGRKEAKAPPVRCCCCCLRMVLCCCESEECVVGYCCLPALCVWWGEGSRRGQSSMGTALSDPAQTGACSPDSRLCKDCIFASQGSIDPSGTQPRRPQSLYPHTPWEASSSVAAVRAICVGTRA